MFLGFGYEYFLFLVFRNIEIAGATSTTYLATTAGNYTVEVTKISTDCSKVSKITKVKITCKEVGNEQNLNNHLLIVYPNPSTNKFTLQLNDDQFYEVQLCDITGKILSHIHKLTEFFY